ncbi:MAG TPA: hypothetical protein ENJ57_06585 [Rhizobiales bacterium]|nr:hypothetical protein [Hyphomicrobiales bacterium]
MTSLRQTRKSGLSAILVLLALVFVATPLSAGESRVPVPHPAMSGKAEKCVAPVPEMRRYHMKYLKHQRVETLRKGVRGNPYSLKACVNCHAVKDKAAGGARTVDAFCGSCHKYAAVTLDCFSCHTNKAQDKKKTAAEASPVNQLAARLEAQAKDRSLVK